MPNPTAYTGFALLMFAGGIAIPIMAALNSQLGIRIGSPWAAAFILFVVGALATGAVLLVNGLPKAPFSAPPQFYAGGLLVSIYILGITWAAPRIGVGNAIFFVLFGQIVAASAIDHFALFGATRSPLTLQRGVGIAFMLVGVFLARRWLEQPAAARCERARLSPDPSSRRSPSRLRMRQSAIPRRR